MGNKSTRDSRIVRSGVNFLLAPENPGVDFVPASRYSYLLVSSSFDGFWYEMVREVTKRDSGGPGGIRTHDSRIKSPELYR